MIYRAKEGSKAYEYLKGVMEAEHKEEEAYHYSLHKKHNYIYEVSFLKAF